MSIKHVAWGLLLGSVAVWTGADTLMQAAHAEEPLRIIAIGAHPDDCELKVGGAAAKVQ